MSIFQKVYLTLKKHWDKVVLTVFILLYITTLATLSILRHNAFASNFDLSNMDQTLYYTLNGHFFSLRLPDEFSSRFAVHADLILVLLSPLYLIYDDVRILIASGSFFLGIGAIPAYLLSLKILKNKIISLCITAVYLLNPGMQWTGIYDFHGVALAIPFLLFAFYFAYVKKWKLYAFFIFLAILTKEQISLNIAMLGLAIFFVLKQRKVGLITFAVGVIWFIMMVYVVMPYFTPAGKHWALEGYGNTSLGELLIARLTHPTVIIHDFLFDKSTQEYYLMLLKPFGFLPLVGLPWLLLSAPDLAINVVRGTTFINFHYDSGVTPALVIATIFGLNYFQSLLKRRALTKRYVNIVMYGLATVLVVVAIRVNYHYSPLPTTPSCWCYIYNVTKEDRAFERALQSIPKEASITGSLEIRPHIGHRDRAFAVPSATESAQYIALITQNRIIGNYEPKDYENKLIPILLSSKKHKVVFRSEHFYLFERFE